MDLATSGQKQRFKTRFKMPRLYSVRDDFEAFVRILTKHEGGRTTPPHNGIRWDLSYGIESESNQIWMVWPDFLDDAGDSLPVDAPLPIDVLLPARLTVVNDELRKAVHRARIHIGTKFYCVEGNKRVAIGTVTRLTGLHDNRERGLAPE